MVVGRVTVGNPMQAWSRANQGQVAAGDEAGMSSPNCDSAAAICTRSQLPVLHYPAGSQH